MSENMDSEAQPKVVNILQSDLPKTVLAGVLSPKGTMFRIDVTGPWDAKGAQRLIDQLQLLKGWLEADDKAAEPPPPGDPA